MVKKQSESDVKKIDVKKFRKLIVKIRSETKTQIEQANLSFNEVVQGNPGLKGDIADQSNNNDPYVLFYTKRITSLGEVFSKCKKAEERLDNGIFGICATCGEVIAEGRLRAMPLTDFCMPCKQKLE